MRYIEWARAKERQRLSVSRSDTVMGGGEGGENFEFLIDILLIEYSLLQLSCEMTVICN